MKYKLSRFDKRHSKNHLTKGAFGTNDFGIQQSMKVIKKSLRTKENSNECGVTK